jgi:hypothetical protein
MHGYNTDCHDLNGRSAQQPQKEKITFLHLQQIKFSNIY